jgi:hypothetical protein
MLSVSYLKDASRREGSECPAYGGERGADIFGDVGAQHGKVYLLHRLTPGEFELLHHLKEQCQLRDRVLARQHKRMALSLPQLMAQLGDDVKLQGCVCIELAPQRRDGDAIGRDWRYRLC